MKNIRKTYKFIIALLLILVALYIYLEYIQEAVIFNAGSGDDRNNTWFNINVNLDQVFITGA